MMGVLVVAFLVLDKIMASVECVVCAWRASCGLKFRYEASETHCREFTRDVTLSKPTQDQAPNKSPEEKKDTDKKAE